MNIAITTGLTEAEAIIGHNNPPEPTPFEAARDKIEALMTEAKNWFDGATVKTQEEADAISKLVDLARKARKEADEARKVEKQPFDDAGNEVQARYNPILKRADMISEIGKKAVAPYLEKLEAEKRAAAEKLRAEAEAKRIEAEAALRASQATDIAAREQAEAMLKEAQKADANARKAENDKAHAKGGARAMTLRTRYVVTLDDPVIAARHMWATRRALMEAYLIELAEQVVASGAREIPGFIVTETKVAV